MSRERIAGYGIAACAVLSVFAVAHHPTLMATSVAEALPAGLRFATPDRIVHGSLILMSGVLLFGLIVFSIQRGIARATSIAALVAYAFGIASVIGAAVFDGFVIPAIFEQYAGRAPGSMESAAALLGLCSIMVQLLTKIGFVAMSIAALAWSVELVRNRGLARWAGFAAIAYAILATVLIATGGRLTPHTLLPLVLLQTLWYGSVAALLFGAAGEEGPVRC